MHSLFPLGMFAYIAGSLALGAHVIGHEFTNRTLASLLVQPCRRSSMLLTKASVLAVMLMALGFIARVVLFQSLAQEIGNFPRYPTLYLPLIGGFCVVPYLTMRLRSQIAGVVFTASIPGMTYVLALLGGVIIYGTGTAAAKALALAVWIPAMWIFAAAGAVLSARSFMRLQDTEGGREELRLPRWFTVTDASPTRPPLWMLAKKELRLQQITFAMVAVYALIWTGLTVAGQLNVDFAREFPMRGVGPAVFRAATSAHGIPRQRAGAAVRHAPIAGDAAGAARAAMGGESECCARPCTRARRGSAVVRIRAAANLPHIVLAAGGEHRASDDVEPVHFVVVRERDYRARAVASGKCGSHGAREVD